MDEETDHAPPFFVAPTQNARKSRPIPTNPVRPSTTNRIGGGASGEKKTVSRSRPHTVSIFRETQVAVGKKRAEHVEGHEHEVADSELESDRPRTVLSDLMDFGDQPDIFSDSDGWDTDLEEKEEDKKEVVPETLSYDQTLQSIYLKSCERHNVIPTSYFVRHMNDPELRMRHHGLGAKGTKPVAIALVSNTSITHLDLSDNWLGVDGGKAICDMLKENCYITNLILCDNRLGNDFATNFKEVLKHNVTLNNVNLSGNLLGDDSALSLAEGILATSRLEVLNLSRNQLSEISGTILGPALAENSSIKELDLSWNCLRKKGAVAISNGIKNNVMIHKLNLSWNGFGTDGSKAIGEALKVNCSLLELDLTNNRVTAEGAVLIGKGLTVNETLKILKLSNNPLQSAGSYGICAGVLRNANSPLRLIEMNGVKVNSDFMELLPKLKENLPDLIIRHGQVIASKRPKARMHPMVKLQNYIQRNNLRLVDFFNKFDKDQSMSVTREEFAAGIQETGIPLNEEEVEFLLNQLDKDGDGEINYSELVMGNQDFNEKSGGGSSWSRMK